MNLRITTTLLVALPLAGCFVTPGPSSCSSGQELCGDICENVVSDPRNCGGCGITCPLNSACSSGVCVSQCGAGSAPCGGVCVNVTSDPNNCGGCGARCGAGLACNSGVCGSPYPHLGLPGGPVPNGAPVYRILPGASTVVQVGHQAGYGITANVGGSYRLVWTGDAQKSGTYREFWGSVYSPGQFTSVTPGCGGVCTLQSDDKITAPQSTGGGTRIDFDSIAADTLNGFDFTVDAEPVFFDLFIDGGRYPQLVFFPSTDNGGQISNVDGFPFGLTTH